MGKLTAQLKKFARKSAIDMRPSLVQPSCRRVVCYPEFARKLCRIDQRIEPADLLAICDPTASSRSCSIVVECAGRSRNVTEGKYCWRHA